MHKSVTIGVLSLALVSLTNVSKTMAQSTDSVNENKITQHNLEQVEVTDSAIAVPINQTARIVTTITKQEIDAVQPKSIQDLLAFVASVDVQTRGVHSVQSDISIRGGTFDQTAILINGINISSPQTGHYSFDIPINIADIERIEIINGPAAIIYGASAFCGGINIITKKGLDKQLTLKMEAGGHKLFSTEVSGALKTGKMENYLSLGYKSTAGYTSNSDYAISNFLYQGRLSLKKNLIDILLGYNNKSYGANTFYSAAFPLQHDSTASYLAAVKGAFHFGHLSFLPSIYWQEHTDYFQLDKNNSKYDNYHKSNVYGSNINFQYSSFLGTTNFGSEVRYEGIQSSVLGKPMTNPYSHYTKEDNRVNYSFFLQHNVDYKRFMFSLGVLTFQNSSIKQDFHLYPSLNVNYKLFESTDIYTSYNSASRLPTFNDLYYTTKTHISNPNLKQEKSQAFELGLKNRNRYVISHIATYYMQGKNMIDWVKKSPNDLWESKNITSLDKYGVEVGGKFFLHELCFALPAETSVQIDYNYLFQQKVKDGYISNYVLNYLKHKLTASLYVPLFSDRLSVTINFRLQKRMGQYLKYSLGKPTQKEDYPLFTTTDVSLNYKCGAWLFYVNMNNIYNTKYFDLGNVPQPGFWFMGGFSLTLGK